MNAVLNVFLPSHWLNSLLEAGSRKKKVHSDDLNLHYKATNKFILKNLLTFKFQSTVAKKSQAPYLDKCRFQMNIPCS
jgi:hypothetical protein